MPMFFLTLMKSIYTILLPFSLHKNNQVGRGVVEYLIKDTVMFSEVRIYNYNAELKKHEKVDFDYKIIMRTYESKEENLEALSNDPTLINTQIGPEGTANFFFTASSSTYYIIRYFIEPSSENIVYSNNLSLQVKHYIGAPGDDKIVSYPQTLIHYLEREMSAAISKCEDLLRLFKSNGLKDMELDAMIDKLKFIIYTTIVIKIIVIIISFYLSNKSTNSFFLQVLGKK